MLTLIKNGYLIDPASDREGYYDLLIAGDRIMAVEANINIDDYKNKITNEGLDQAELQIFDAKGCYVMPGFIDLHVHLREPGYEYKETIASGAMAAAAGGYTTICAMPNTKPVCDSAETVSRILKKAAEVSKVNVLPVGAITINQGGTELTDIYKLKQAGAVALSEDGKSVMDTALYAEAMRKAARLDIPVFAHCEDKSLVKDGVINAGKKAEELGLSGISNAVEDVIVARDILLAKETGARLHLCHCSTKDSATMVALAKQAGLKVTAEVCPHHFTLSDEDILSDDANYKMNPPLRSPEDVRVLCKALKDDIIDVIATDHAPHSDEEKAGSFKTAPFGIVGLETAFALVMTWLVKPGILTLKQMVEKMSVNPAAILKLDRGKLKEGSIADLVIADPEAEYVINKEQFYSKGKNTPFHGRRVRGRIEYTFVAGNLVYSRQVGLHEK